MNTKSPKSAYVIRPWASLHCFTVFTIRMNSTSHMAFITELKIIEYLITGFQAFRKKSIV